MKNIVCAICKKNNSKVIYKPNFSPNDLNQNIFSARRLPDRIHYQIMQCKDCGLIYSNPIFSKREIEKLYKKSKFTYQIYEEYLTKTYIYYIQKYLPFIKSRNNFLEIGCGNGFLFNRIYKLGFKKVIGVEPSQDSIKKANQDIRKNIINNIFKPNLFKTNSFDLICFFQVIDHLPDPLNFLKECYRILKPGGGILCICHNSQSLSAKILKEKSPIIDIEHTYLYDNKTLSMIFEKHHFETVDVFPVANLYPVSYWLRMFPFPGIIKKTLFLIADIVGISSKRISLNAGNIGIFVRKPGNL